MKCNIFARSLHSADFICQFKDISAYDIKIVFFICRMCQIISDVAVHIMLLIPERIELGKIIQLHGKYFAVSGRLAPVQILHELSARFFLTYPCGRRIIICRNIRYFLAADIFFLEFLTRYGINLSDNTDHQIDIRIRRHSHIALQHTNVDILSVRREHCCLNIAQNGLLLPEAFCTGKIRMLPACENDIRLCKEIADAVGNKIHYILRQRALIVDAAACLVIMSAASAVSIGNKRGKIRRLDRICTGADRDLVPGMIRTADNAVRNHIHLYQRIGDDAEEIRVAVVRNGIGALLVRKRGIIRNCGTVGMRIVFAITESLADNAELLLCQIGIHKQTDQRFVIVCGIAKLTVHRLADLRKSDRIHIQAIIECRCNVLFLVDVIANLLEQFIDDSCTASIILLDYRMFRWSLSLRNAVVVDDDDVFRRKAADISLTVKAVNCDQKLRQNAVFVQIFDMADLNAELVQHNEHIGLADLAFSGIKQARLFSVSFQIAAKRKSGSDRVGIGIVMHLNDNIIIAEQMLQQRFVFHKALYSFSDLAYSGSIIPYSRCFDK